MFSKINILKNYVYVLWFIALLIQLKTVIAFWVCFWNIKGYQALSKHIVLFGAFYMLTKASRTCQYCDSNLSWLIDELTTFGITTSPNHYQMHHNVSFDLKKSHGFHVTNIFCEIEVMIFLVGYLYQSFKHVFPEHDVIHQAARGSVRRRDGCMVVV